MTNEMITKLTEQEVLGKEFRVYGTKEEPLFLAKDVAGWIEYPQGNITNMLRTVDEEEKLKLKMLIAGQNRETMFLTEDGLYEVLMQSRKPIAKAFKKEVKTILKSIRQNCGYISKNATAKQVEILNKKWLEKSKYLTEEIHDRKSIRKYIRGYDKMKIDECINTIAEMTSKIKGEVKHDLLDVAIKELRKIDDELQFDNNKHTYIKNTCKDGIVTLQDVKIGKYKRRIITLEQ